MFCNLVKFEFMRSQNNISNYVAHTRNYLLCTYFCCHSETQENTSMLISMIFLYVAGIIFINSRVEPSVYIIFHVCCRELTSPIGGNHKPSRNMFFFQHLFVKCRLDLSFTRNTSIKLCALSL